MSKSQIEELLKKGKKHGEILQLLQQKGENSSAELNRFYTSQKLAELLKEGNINSQFVRNLYKLVISKRKPNEINQFFNSLLSNLDDLKTKLAIMEECSFDLDLFSHQKLMEGLSSHVNNTGASIYDSAIGACRNSNGALTFSDLGIVSDPQTVFSLYINGAITPDELKQTLSGCRARLSEENKATAKPVTLVTKTTPVEKIADLFESGLIDHADVRRLIKDGVIAPEQEEQIIGTIEQQVFSALFGVGSQILSHPRSKADDKQSLKPAVCRKQRTNKTSPS